jgi:hypothetical protein
MELRLLTTDAERAGFRTSMLEARASRGGKFRETARSRVSEIQLAFARLYGVFDEAKPDRMLGGFSIHCLNEFSQSFPIPNLSHLAPSSVYEAGQLWTFSHEAAQALRQGSMILLGLLQAQALLIYPLIIPRDVSTLYRVFKRVGPPFELPFAETLTGEKVYLQAMLLEGELRLQVELASHDGFETRGCHSLIRFDALNIDANSWASHSRLQMIEGSDASARLGAKQPNSPKKPANVLASPSENTGFERGTLNDAGVEAKPTDPGEDSPAGRWSWCEYANEPRCPFHPECQLRCRGKGLLRDSNN